MHEARPNERTRLVKVGEIGVDSGRILILDPCSEGKIGDYTPTGTPGVSNAKRADSGVDVGVVVSTPHGDGTFPVVAEFIDGELHSLLIDFNPHVLSKTPREIRAEITSTPPEAWKGTEPAEGTRRALIRDTIERVLSGRVFESGSLTLCGQLADEIESALLQTTVEERSGLARAIADAHRQIDRTGVRRYTDFPERVRELVDRYVGLVEKERDLRDRDEELEAAERAGTVTAGLVVESDLEGSVIAESYEDRLLGQREDARAGEDRFKAQRDAALRLLQQLLGDVVPVEF